jgi:hypothetical protein
MDTLYATLAPQNYVRKPFPVKAMRFVGGKENAERIISWLNSINIQARYREADGTASEAVSIARVGNVQVNQLVVSFGVGSPAHSTSFIQVVNEENFNRRFEKS